MIISDNETKLDMLNNYSIASTVVTLIKENGNVPISIGIHGDWGAGKSSVLEMIESEISNEGNYLCVKFNGWKHQGFEDAKIALIESIVSELVSEKSLADKAGDKVKKIWENINWMKVAKATGSIAVSAATGIPPISLLKDGLGVIGDTITDKGKRDSAIENIFSQIKTSDQSVSKEFNEFSKTFHELLEASEYKKVVVLIDDLDRCLPNVIIETLEAVRLFMFEESTAFVVAADEIMVEYAVKEHFPVYDSNVYGDEFARRYLEKLIQVPFRLPFLGESESKNYIMLLLVGSEINDDKIFNDLVKHTLEENRRPWQHNELSTVDFVRILGDSYAKVQGQIQIGSAISSTLAKGTIGNPRQMKRFINTLLLRYGVAKSRGIDDDIDINILAKLMLAERFYPVVYEKIALDLDSKGISKILQQSDIPVKVVKKGPVKSVEKDNTTPEIDKEDEKLTKSISKWNLISPDISKEDLRPYFFISREKNNWEASLLEQTDNIKLLLPILSRGSSMAIAGVNKEILRLSATDIEFLFKSLSQEFSGADSYNSKPPALLGLQELTKNFEELQSNMISLLSSIPPEKIGSWATSGWSGIFTGENREKYIKIVSSISENGKGTVKSTAKSQLSKLKGDK